MPKLDIAAAPLREGSIYPEPYATQMAGRTSRRLGHMAGLKQFGANVVYLEPGAVASLRHWHLREDEFAVVLTGELVLAEDTGEAMMHPGDCAAWSADVANGHRFENHSGAPASFLIVGGRSDDEVVTYTQVDMKIHLSGGAARFTYHDGSDWVGPRDLPTKGDSK
jgi:uncharacterized cupin superfamily protein